MPRKPLDTRIPELINESVKTNTRSVFVIVGSQKQQNAQITNLHYLLTQARLQHANSKADRPNVLWCYKKDLGFTSNRNKREAKLKRDIKRGVREEGDLNAFELFLGVTDIRYCYYKETPSILGQTYGMLVLQDFEALTPNILARTIETVQGGGIVTILLSGLTSLKRLYTMSMDVHSRYRTESSGDPVARFNERFILSLGSCSNSLVVDDELNVLPISTQKDPLSIPSTSEASAGAQIKSAQEHKELKTSLKDVQPVGAVVECTKTLDQAHALLAFVDAIQQKTLSSTVTLTAARGRGKSACLGLAISLAVAHGYSNIFLTSPTPENLSTVFEFFFKGLQELGYTEHIDWDVVRSAHEDWRGAVVRVNIFRDHRQTVQYIRPEDSHVLGQAELVVIDEAAAIPLPLVKKLLGPYLVFLSSTINGYEGTGRSLSLKLIQQLRESSRGSISSKDSKSNEQQSSASSTITKSLTRSLKEIKLDEPIRYGQGDPIEKWLNSLLCLDATSSTRLSSSSITQGPSAGPGGNAPHPSLCELYHVSRDTLFSFHPASEVFLQRIMALYVASHYKNSPNDLQLLSDAPNHAVFVLLPPLSTNNSSLPEPLAVVQVALEGKISKNTIMNSLDRGQRAGGDLIPWTLSQQYQDDGFATMSGARVVRIAVHPDYAKMGYGSRTLELLAKFYSGQLVNLDEPKLNSKSKSSSNNKKKDETNGANGDLHTEKIKVRDASTMEPLLQQLSDVPVEPLDYIGTSYGLTGSLFTFWKRAGYVPLYVRQTKNDLTGEHTCIMIKPLQSSDEPGSIPNWLSAFTKDFRKRLLSLLSFAFKDFTSKTALSILESTKIAFNEESRQEITDDELRNVLSPYDFRRLNSYSNNILDYHAILDLLPTLVTLYFNNRFSAEVTLSTVQRSILLSLGAQHKTIEEIVAENDIQVSQALALLTKVVRKLTKALEEVQKNEIGKTIPSADISASTTSDAQKSQPKQPLATSNIEDELEHEGDLVKQRLREQQRDVINSLDLDQYAIGGDDEQWKEAEAHVAAGLDEDGTLNRATVVSVKGASSAPKSNVIKEKSSKESKRKASDSRHGSKGKKQKQK